jgi:hypothetical protein
MKNVTYKYLKYREALGAEVQETAVPFMVWAAYPPPSPAEERPDLRRPLVEPLPPQFEQSLSMIARRIRWPI